MSRQKPVKDKDPDSIDPYIKTGLATDIEGLSPEQIGRYRKAVDRYLTTLQALATIRRDGHA